MRDVAPIWEAWSSGIYVGDTKPCTRVTVEKDYWLRRTGQVIGRWNRGPARWFQRDSNGDVYPSEDWPQIETEIPNVCQVTYDESIDTDATTYNVTVDNVRPLQYGDDLEDEDAVSQVGWMHPDHGQSQESKARWGHEVNEWADVLEENALIRIYTGFGGEDKTLPDAINDGNLVLDGVFLVDTVETTTDGRLSIKGRGMSKLLLEQPLMPPLVPKNLYPLRYYRWDFDTFKIPPDSPVSDHDILTQGFFYQAPGDGYASSSDEAFDDYDRSIGGHRPSDCMDWSYDDPPDAGPGEIAHQRTYWLSEGHSTANETCWITGRPDDFVNLFYAHAWGGNYEMFISIYENGEWVPPEDSGRGGITPDGIPYVAKFGLPWEEGVRFPLPRTYKCQYFRVTLRNLTKSTYGDFRGGLRKIVPLYDRSRHEYPSLVFTSTHISPNMDDRVGYWQARSDGKIYGFGDARSYPPTSTRTNHVDILVGMCAHPDGLGYWTVDTQGMVVSYGSAEHYGDHVESVDEFFDVVDIACTPTGEGYWLLHKDGTVSAWGDATHEGDATPSGTMPSGAPKIARSIESHPDTVGYWILISDGEVQEFNLTNHGSANRSGFTDTEYVASIRRTSTGNGYWIPSGGGRVQAFGDADEFGDATAFPIEKWVYGLCWDLIPSSNSDNGYAIQHADGTLDVRGDFDYFGSIGEGEGQIRKPGNYKDYADIVKEILLWSGFYFFPYGETDLRMPGQTGNWQGYYPPVYANVESTGAYAKEDLPEDMFDKRPGIEVITELKEIVGYIFYTDGTGAPHFESPNFWSLGNFDENGNPLDLMPEIDESLNMTDLTAIKSDEQLRSELTIASADPNAKMDGTVITRIVPQGARALRGMVKPAQWINGAFADEKEQRRMAELISLHIWFSRRQYNTSCVANPLIGINDQIRIYERQSGATFICYVRGKSFSHDLDSGDYSMSLTVNWLGGQPLGGTPIFKGCTMHPDGLGYYQLATNGDVYAWGMADLYSNNETLQSHVERAVRIRAHPGGEGYWTMDVSGKILSYGAAENFGSIFDTTLGARDFAVTPTGDGYLILQADGTVTAFGDAVDLGGVTPSGELPNGGGAYCAESIEHHPTSGYWVLEGDGTVTGFGSATEYGDADRDDFRGYERCVAIRTTPAGDGYFVLSGYHVQAFGSAVWDGDPELYTPRRKFGWASDILVSGDDGYSPQRQDGQLVPFGTMTHYGDAGGPEVRQRLWALVTEAGAQKSPIPRDVAVVSDDVVAFLKGTGSKAALQAVMTNFGEPSEPTLKAVT